MLLKHLYLTQIQPSFNINVSAIFDLQITTSMLTGYSWQRLESDWFWFPVLLQIFAASSAFTLAIKYLIKSVSR